MNIQRGATQSLSQFIRCDQIGRKNWEKKTFNRTTSTRTPRLKGGDPGGEGGKRGKKILSFHVGLLKTMPNGDLLHIRRGKRREKEKTQNPEYDPKT